MGVGSGYGMKTLETSGFDLAGGEGEIATQCLVAPTGRGGEDLACELLPNDSLIPHIHTHTHSHPTVAFISTNGADPCFSSCQA